MTAFRVDRFSGERPIDNARKLPKGGAQDAYDCNLRAFDLRPFADIAHIAGVSGVSAPKSAFVFSEDQMFVFDEDTSATYGPIQASEDVKNKVYIDSGFQAYPVYSTKELGLPDPDDPYHGPPINHRKLGVPPPSTPATVVLSANTTGTVLECVATEGVMNVYVGALIPHGFKDGDRVRIDGLNEDWNDVSGQTYVITVVDTLNFTLNNYLATAHDGSVDPATPSGMGTYSQEFNAEDIEDRIYVYTLVTDQGEEGPPSEPSALVTMNPGQIPTVTTDTAAPAPTIATLKRIYRTVPSSTGTADYFFVAEIPLTTPDYADTVAFIELGEQMQSLEWYPPPADLKGLTVLPNGIMVGFVDRTLWMCEPYQPHAWPESYTKKMDNTIVRVAAFGQSLVVATEENPYVGTATDPLSMTLSKLDTVEPCISGRACKTLGYGAVYPSPNGLVLVTPAGVKNILQNVWVEKDWRALFAAGEAFAEVHDNKYYLFFTGGDGIVFDPTSDTLEISHITMASYGLYGVAVDRDEDRLYLLRYSGGSKVGEWNPDAGTTFIETRWLSRTFVMPYAVNMGAYQCFYSGSGTIEIDFYADGVLKHTATVTDQEPDRLPSGFLAREWEIEIRSTVEIQGVYVAETIGELRGALAS